MIVTASGGRYIPDFEDFSFNCLGYNEVSNAVNCVWSFFDHADVAACSFFENMMVPGCVETPQKFKQLQDAECASSRYGASAQSQAPVWYLCDPFACTRGDYTVT